MKIVLLEPLGISQESLDKLAEKLTKQGHEFTAYDSFSTDTEELKKRSEGADALIIANHPLPGEGCSYRAGCNARYAGPFPMQANSPWLSCVPYSKSRLAC